MQNDLCAYFFTELLRGFLFLCYIFSLWFSVRKKIANKNRNTLILTAIKRTNQTSYLLSDKGNHKGCPNEVKSISIVFICPINGMTNPIKTPMLGSKNAKNRYYFVFLTLFSIFLTLFFIFTMLFFIFITHKLAFIRRKTAVDYPCSPIYKILNVFSNALFTFSNTQNHFYKTQKIFLTLFPNFPR